ncbi:MAG: hypothetical protein DCC58_12445 [Chloroflexi bacterium]|nr:MAG: hypothetical protein DCC58_12445 [Chloroflexota bacterium]
MASWVESTSYVAGDPARVAVLIAVVQAGTALDDNALTQATGILHQQFAGHPLETAVLLKHVHDLANRGLLVRDGSGFRWTLSPLGELVVRQWTSGAYDPPGAEPLSHEEVRAWRDRAVAQLEADARLAEQAEVAIEELAAGSALRLAELRVLNRVIAEDVLPSWLAGLRQE